ncbi:MAG TPA: signal recognition particle protein, partial [Candidatus Omnitrophica bacterium]|nr:signal recognition particle protein [Candidatus Omnitrophota bacterium]
RVVKEFITSVTNEAIGEKVLKSVTPSQQLVKIVHERLIELLGKDASPLVFSSLPLNTFMLVGLHGSGKTTSCGKLARFCQNKGHRVLLVGTDTRRPAAQEQLRSLGNRLNLPVVIEGRTPLQIAKNAMKEAHLRGVDTVIMDTQGRLHIDDELMSELIEMKKTVSPTETLLVADAMTGQDAVNIAKSFNEKLALTGVILTKLDTDARGGAALSIKAVSGVAIKFVGMGEGMEDLDVFYPDRMASRILGMGDIVTLVERAEQQEREEEAERLMKKLKAETFDLEDFLAQLQQMRKIGPLSKMLDYLPVEPSLRDVEFSEERYKQVEAIILSMTPEERSNPRRIDGSRRKRIAKGSGTNVQAVNQLLKQFFVARKFMKQMMKKGAEMKQRGWVPKLS